MGVTPVPPARPPRGMEAQGSSKPWGGTAQGTRYFTGVPPRGCSCQGYSTAPLQQCGSQGSERRLLYSSRAFSPVQDLTDQLYHPGFGHRRDASGDSYQRSKESPVRSRLGGQSSPGTI